MPNSAPANASAEPHWPAPVSVVELLDAGLGVVPGLRHRGVRLVRAGRRDAFVLVVDLRRRAERLLEAVRADQRRRPPQAEHLAHRLGNLDLAFGRDLLHDQRHREQRRQVVGARPAGGCRGAAPAAAASAGRRRCCTSGFGILLSSSTNLVGELIAASPVDRDGSADGRRRTAPRKGADAAAMPRFIPGPRQDGRRNVAGRPPRH